uniref:Flagellar basal body P-ring formation protein FlgA n=1 Tax=Desulfacinum infernum TaxID=35837 RepID=A0A832A2Y0_9BACT
MRSILITLSVLGLLWPGLSSASPQDAQLAGASAEADPSVLQVRSVVETSQETLSLYDLIDNGEALPPRWAGAFRSIPLGQSPPVGSEKTVRTDNLGPYLKKVLASLGTDPEQVFLSIPERITLRRKAATVNPQLVEDLYRAYIRDHAPWDPAEMDIRDIVISGLAAVPEGEVTQQIEAPPETSFLGVVPLTIHFFVEGRKVRSLRVAGKVTVRKKVLHAAQNLRRDTVLGPEHLEFREILLSDAAKTYATRMEELVGKRLIRPVNARQPIETAFVDKPLCITSGKPVTILYQDGSLKLTAKGESKESGAEGDWIRVVNAASQKTLKAKVVDETTVALNP